MPFCTECGGEHSGISSSCKRCGAELSSTADLKPAVSRVSTNIEASTASSPIWSLPLLKPERGEWNIPLGVVYFIGLPILILLLIDIIIPLPDNLTFGIAIVGFFLILLSVAFLGLSLILPPLIAMSARVQDEWTELTESARGVDQSKARTAIVAFLVLFSLFVITGIVGGGAILAHELDEGPEVSEAALNSESIRAGDSVGVDGVITNDGDESKSTTIELTANGEVIDSQEVELDPGESREIRFDVKFESPGEYDIELLGETVGTLVVEHNIEVTDATLNKKEIGTGSSAKVTAVGTNVGNTTESRTIELTADGNVHDSEEVTLGPGEEREIRLTSRFDNEGEYDIQIDNVPVGTLSVVDLGPAEFEVVNTSLSDSQMALGGSTTVTAEIENVGGETGSHNVTLHQNDDLIDQQEVTISPGDKQTVSFSFQSNELGEHTLRVNDKSAGSLAITPVKCPNTTPEYDVVSTRDISFLDVNRYSIEIQLTNEPVEYSYGDIEDMSNEIICEFTENTDVNSLAIFYVHPDQSIQDGLFFARTYWAPNGEWGDAMDVETGDYTEHELSITGRPKFEIKSMNGPDSVEIGEEFTIQVTVENQGIESGEFTDFLGDSLDNYGSISGQVEAKEEKVIQSEPIKIEDCPTLGEIRFSLSRDYTGAVEIQFTEPNSDESCW